MIDLFETENQIHFTVMKILVSAWAQPTMISSHSEHILQGYSVLSTVVIIGINHRWNAPRTLIKNQIWVSPDW